MDKKDEIKVFMSNKECTCSECGNYVEMDDLITLEKNNVLCIFCSDLGYLTFLPSGNTALSRRSKKYSAVSAIVYKFSKSRKRNERQGILVSESALLKAEDECIADQDERLKRRIVSRKRRDFLDKKYIKAFSEKIRDMYPNCPTEESEKIANHACEKYSGRVGRSSAAKNMETFTIALAVRAHIRHLFTDYDKLLNVYSREEARRLIQDDVDVIELEWKKSSL